MRNSWHGFTFCENVWISYRRHQIASGSKSARESLDLIESCAGAESGTKFTLISSLDAASAVSKNESAKWAIIDNLIRRKFNHWIETSSGETSREGSPESPKRQSREMVIHLKGIQTDCLAEIASRNEVREWKAALYSHSNRKEFRRINLFKILCCTRSYSHAGMRSKMSKHCGESTAKS